MTSVKIFSVDVAAVRRGMDDYARKLLATYPEVEEVVVFGSFENDTYAPGSDIDTGAGKASIPRRKKLHQMGSMLVCPGLALP